MPPLRSARSLQPHIVLDDIFKNKSDIGTRMNIVTSVGPPWARRFSADENTKSSNIPQHRTINLRSRGNPQVITIKDETVIHPKQRKSMETKDSDAARTRGLPLGIKRKLAAAFECSIKTENFDEPELMVIDDKTKISKIPIQPIPETHAIAGAAKLSVLTPKYNKNLAIDNSQRIVDIENRSISTVKVNNDESNTPKTRRITSTRAAKKVAVASKKRGRPLGAKNKKVLPTCSAPQRTIDAINCSCMDVIILDDKTEIPKAIMQREAEHSIVARSSKSRGRPSKSDMETFVAAIFKRKDDIIQANGELVSERDVVWQRIRHDLEYQVTAQTLRRVAKSKVVYKMLTSHQDEEVEPVKPTVKTVEHVPEIEVLAEPKLEADHTERFERALEILAKTLEDLFNAMTELREEFHRHWNKSTQNDDQ